MHIEQALPPNYHDICKVVKADPRRAVFTHGDTIFNPSGRQLSEDLLVHETVHIGQQVKSAEIWWERWISDKKFRLEQELAAYAYQYAFVCARHKDRNVRNSFLFEISCHLSSEMYGNIAKHSEAMQMIRQASGVKDKHYK